VDETMFYNDMKKQSVSTLSSLWNKNWTKRFLSFLEGATNRWARLSRIRPWRSSHRHQYSSRNFKATWWWNTRWRKNQQWSYRWRNRPGHIS
jgi:hypothetical protein